MDIIETIKEQIANNPVLLYMKGSPNAPQCGFSARATQAVMGCGEKFAYVDILQNPEIRVGTWSRMCWASCPVGVAGCWHKPGGASGQASRCLSKSPVGRVFSVARRGERSE